MFQAGLFTGALTGYASGIGLMCLLTAGKWADEQMIHHTVKETDRDETLVEGNAEKNQREEGQVDGCGNETM